MIFATKNRIALFGTSADPPTIGHKQILEELAKIYSCIFVYAIAAACTIFFALPLRSPTVGFICARKNFIQLTYWININYSF